MDLGLTNKTAFVAASSQGLGKSSALELAREGANVILNGRNVEMLEQTRQEVDAVGEGAVLAVAGDLSVQAERENVINTTLKRFPDIDILVTNTGGPPAGKFEDLPPEEWDKTYQLLLNSAVSLVRGFLASMKRQEWGRIISITSQAVKQPVEN